MRPFPAPFPLVKNSRFIRVNSRPMPFTQEPHPLLKYPVDWSRQRAPGTVLICANSSPAREYGNPYWKKLSRRSSPLAVLWPVYGFSLQPKNQIRPFAALEPWAGCSSFCPLSHAALRGGRRANLGKTCLHFIQGSALCKARLGLLYSVAHGRFFEDKKKTRLPDRRHGSFRFFCSSSAGFFLQLAPAAAWGCDLSGLRILSGRRLSSLTSGGAVTRGKALMWMPIAIAVGLMVHLQKHGTRTPAWGFRHSAHPWVFAMPGLLLFQPAIGRWSAPACLPAPPDFLLWSAAFLISPLVAAKYPRHSAQ